MDRAEQSERTLVRRPAALVPAAPLAHVLRLRDEGEAPRRVPLAETALHIGRGPQNGLVLPSPDVSPPPSPRGHPPRAAGGPSLVSAGPHRGSAAARGGLGRR